jgi:hypothetical protein
MDAPLPPPHPKHAMAVIWNRVRDALFRADPSGDFSHACRELRAEGYAVEIAVVNIRTGERFVPYPVPAGKVPVGPASPEVRAAVDRAMRDDPTAPTGDVCPNCGGSRTVRTGRCLTCQDCGTSIGGCS